MTKPNLTTIAERISFPDSHFIYREKKGPFMKMAQLAWQEFWQLTEKAVDKSLMTDRVSLHKVDLGKEGDERFVYQAGALVSAMPPSLPEGLQYRMVTGGAYACFTLTGSYHQLPQAWPAAYAQVEASDFVMRRDFAMERCLNTPRDTPQEALKTQILIPIE